MGRKMGSTIEAYCLKLRCSYSEWIQQTEEFYNQILGFYFNLLMDHLDWLELGNMELLHRLEQMTISGRDKQPVSDPLPFPKVSLYFRRAAIKEARSYAKQLHNCEQKKLPQKRNGIYKKRKASISTNVSYFCCILQGNV